MYSEAFAAFTSNTSHSFKAERKEEEEEKHTYAHTQDIKRIYCTLQVHNNTLKIREIEISIEKNDIDGADWLAGGGGGDCSTFVAFICS